MCEGSPFSTPSPAFVCRIFDDGHPDQREVICHCSFNNFIYLLVVLGLRCCSGLSLVVEWGLFFIAVCGLLIVVAFLVRCGDLFCRGGQVPGHGLQSLQHACSVAGLCGLNCSTTCGILETRD